ncbi:hypothetical protein F0562_022403 [Nyssa sinensis]|uniref:Uncharacterized protein n=1 Tax=Nyssa sinensis TaxID=561372 RepID=A0A5J5BT26_9ASTE|nr:hypothetical protein F0562_022403 [Nyssa sinensis]
METKSTNFPILKESEDLNFVRMKLDIAQEKLSNSAQTISVYGSLEKTIIEADKLSSEIEAMEDAIQMKQREIASLKLLSSDIQERRALIDKKLMALKYSLSSFSSSIGYFEQREVQARARKGPKSVEEMEQRLQNIIQEKEMLLEMKTNGRTEFENMILECHQCMFEAELKEEETKILEEELQMELRRITELETVKAAVTERKTQLLEATKCNSCFVSDQIEEELQNIRMSVLELKSLLGDDSQSPLFNSQYVKPNL